MKLVQIADSRAVHAYMQPELGLHWSDDFRGVMYVPEEYRFEIARPEHVAVAIAYNNFVGRTCCMHCVIRGPEYLTRTVIREAFEFPFVVCDREVVIGLVDTANEAAMRFDLKLGFTEIARIDGGGVDADLSILQMRRSSCRWLKQLH